MSLPKEKRQLIRNELLEEIKATNKVKISAFAKRFNISRQSVYVYLKNMEKENIIRTETVNQRKHYFIIEKNELYKKEYSLKTPQILEEGAIWRQEVLPTFGIQ